MSPEICDLVVENPDLWIRFANRFSIHKTMRPGAFTFNPELNFVLTTDADQYMRDLKTKFAQVVATNLTTTEVVPEGKLWRIWSWSIYRGTAGINYCMIGPVSIAEFIYVDRNDNSNLIKGNLKGHPLQEFGTIRFVSSAAGSDLIQHSFCYTEEDLF